MNKKALVVTPVYKKDLDKYELISIKSAIKHLHAYEKTVMAPEKFMHDEEFHKIWNDFGYSITYFDDKHFEGIEAHNRFMLTADFYERFTDYEYILVCQTDVLILSDRLEEWLSKGHDFIGAPWVYKDEGGLKFNHAGNGGFSLRRVQSFLEVIKAEHFYPKELDKAFLDHQYYNPYPIMMKTLLHLKPLRRFAALFQSVYYANEDRFWSCYATFYRNEFKVADVKESLSFAFEQYPKFCYEHNDKELPFGTHAWQEYDLAFWKAKVPELTTR